MTNLEYSILSVNIAELSQDELIEIASTVLDILYYHNYNDRYKEFRYLKECFEGALKRIREDEQ